MHGVLFINIQRVNFTFFICYYYLFVLLYVQYIANDILCMCVYHTIVLNSILPFLKNSFLARDFVRLVFKTMLVLLLGAIML